MAIFVIIIITALTILEFFMDILLKTDCVFLGDNGYPTLSWNTQN